MPISISLALKKLNISFELLQEYGKLLELDISGPSYHLSQEEFIQIKDLHSHEATRNKLISISVDKISKKLKAYKDGEFLRLFGKVKWFGDKSKNGDYGFLEIQGFDDVFFHYKQVDNISRVDLKEGLVCVVNLEENNFYTDRKKSAALVSAPAAETDIYFMLHCLSFPNSLSHLTVASRISDQFISNLKEVQYKITHKERVHFTFLVSNYLKNKTIKGNIIRNFNELIPVLYSPSFEPENKIEISESCEEYILDSDYHRFRWSFIFNFKNFCGIKDNKELEYLIKEKSPEEDKLFWWSKYKIHFPIEEILEQLALDLIKAQPEYEAHLDSLSQDEITRVFDVAYDKIIKRTEATLPFSQLTNFLKLASQYKQEIDLNLLDDKTLFVLWDQEYIEFFPVNAVRYFLKEQFEKSKKKHYSHEINKDDRSVRIFLKRLTEQQLRDLVSCISLEEDNIKTREQYQEVKYILENLDNKRAEESGIVEMVFEWSSEFNKLQLFIEDFTETINYDEAVLYTGLLESENQKLFFKKLIKLIEENKLELSLEDLNRITTIDYETSEVAREIDGIGLDFTLSIIIKVLNDLKHEVLTKKESIFSIVASLIKRPKDLLVIDGFFDHCNGRGVIESTETPTEDAGEFPEYKIVKSENRKPRYATFCDGKKAVNRLTGEPSLCKKSGKEFWWCENDKCFEIARKLHTPGDWRDYTLADVLRVLDIEYNDNQYEKMLGIINRANRYFEHLTCRKCNKILKPAGEGNYGFYRVSNFQCQDAACEEYNNIIYLSHCANGACQDIIDSRDSVKCKPGGHSQECGWYICNNCFACCSTKKLKGRQYVYEMTGQKYDCHIIGHKDRGVICCNKCGEEMIEKEQNGELYKKQLKWFIDQKETHINISNHGTRQDGKWWFIWDQGNFSFEDYRKHLKNLYSTGFNIPDYHQIGNTSQLVAEPFRENNANRVFLCTSCENLYKITDLEEFDYTRQNSISKYHNEIFVNQNN